MTKPTDVAMTAREARTAALIERLGRGSELWQDFTWPGGRLTCRIRVLSNSDLQLATAGAILRWRELGVELTPIMGEDFADEVVTQRLFLALEDPGRPIAGDRHGRCERLFESVDQFRDLTTAGERAAVFSVYVELDAHVDPDLGRLTAEDVRLIEDAVKKKDEGALRGFAPSTLRRWLLTTALLHGT